MSVKYSWNRQNGAAMPSVRFMSIEPAEDYYKGMPLKLKEKGIVEPTDGDPEYICMAQYDPDAEIQPLEIPVQEVFPDVIYEKINNDGTTEEVRFGSRGGGGGDLLETVETEVPLEITWDGDIDGKEMFDSGNGNNTYFVKISDVILTKEQMLNAVTIDPSTNEELILTEEKIVDAAEVGLPALMGGSYILSVYSSLDMGNGIAISTGLYFYYIDSDSYVTHLTCPNATTTTTKTQLKPSLLPNHKHKWDDLEDAICYDRSVSAPLNITFDGNIDGHETFAPGGDQIMVKLSDAVLTVDDLIGGTVICVVEGQETQIELTNENVVDILAESGMPAIMVGSEMVMVIYGDVSASGLPLTPGVWVAYIEDAMLVKSISNTNVTNKVGDIKKIDNKFLDLAWLPTTRKQNVEILPEMTVDFTGSKMNDVTVAAVSSIFSGIDYTVYWNGAEYKYTAKPISFWGLLADYIGNANIINESEGLDTGEEFAVLSATESGVRLTMVMVRNGGITATIQIYGKETVYNKIPDNFLPPTASKTPLWFSEFNHAGIKEIATALAKGHEVYIKNTGNSAHPYHVISAFCDTMDGWDLVLMTNPTGIYYISGHADNFYDGIGNDRTIRPLLTTYQNTCFTMLSPSGKKFRLSIDDDGNLKTESA